jgi:hypothetical protein
VMSRQTDPRGSGPNNDHIADVRVDHRGSMTDEHCLRSSSPTFGSRATRPDTASMQMDDRLRQSGYVGERVTLPGRQLRAKCYNIL